MPSRTNHPFFQDASNFRRMQLKFKEPAKITGFFWLQAHQRERGTLAEETPTVLCFDASQELFRPERRTGPLGTEIEVNAIVNVGVVDGELRCKIQRPDAPHCPFVVFLISAKAAERLLLWSCSRAVLEGLPRGAKEFARRFSAVPTLTGTLDEHGQAFFAERLPEAANGPLSCRYILVAFDK